MPSLLSRYQQDASSSPIALALTLFLTSVVAYLGTSPRHSLLINALAWGAICTYSTVLKSGWRSLLDSVPGQKLAWIAGALLALVAVGERAVDSRGVWWAKGLVPGVLYIFAHAELIAGDAASSSGSPPASPVKSKPTARRPGSRSSLSILSGSAVVAIFAAMGSNATIALGLSNAILLSLAFILVERARSEAQHGRTSGASVIYSANGLLTQSNKPEVSSNEAQAVVLRNVSAAAMVFTGIAAIMLERFSFGGLSYGGVLGPAINDQKATRQHAFDAFLGLCMAFTSAIANGALLLMIQRHGAVLSSFVPMSAAIISQLFLNFSIVRLGFAALCAASTAAFLNDQDTIPGLARVPVRPSRLLTLLALILFGLLTLQQLRRSLASFIFSGRSGVLNPDLPGGTPQEPLDPLEYTSTRVHPMDQLVRDAEASWSQTLQSQSRNLDEAVAEYKRRYRIPPPPNFDKWYEFATRKGVKLIDEYDSIYHSLLPFWALPPATIRARAREALGFPNALMGLLIRNGKSQRVEEGPEWLREAIVGMIAGFVEHLPDMDMAFNIHDEPRVVVPHDDLSRMVEIALKRSLPQALANPSPKNAFSARPADVNTGRRIAEVETTRFNVFAHQPTWIPSRLSCSPESQARVTFGTEAADNYTSYALGELGFVYNHTAFSDVCNSPSFSKTHGFFDRPNAFNVVHDLFPIFSQSKMSSFQDILYPSPWYWYGKVGYIEEKDYEWELKSPHLFWRGSTTGGFSRDGGWRRQHRQHIVQKLNALGEAQIMENIHRESDPTAAPEWNLTTVDREQYKLTMDVHFSHVGQCDPGDCDAQREFFHVAPEINQQDAWKFRYLLDMDGNAFSGRFYAFLKSRSLTFKMAVFREWHEEWLRPWVHYIPLSLRADEALEAVRYLSSEPEGKKTAKRMADSGRDWANAALRNEDLEAWLFRLMLEYGRLIDDNRAEIGFAGS